MWYDVMVKKQIVRFKLMDDKERQQYIKMTKVPPAKLITGLAIPAVISMLTTMIYNLVDAFFVGRLGTSASAAIGIIMSLQAIFQAAGFMFGHGTGSIIGRKLSEARTEEANRFLTLAIMGGITLGSVMMVVGLAFRTPLVYMLGSTDTIMPYARKYAFYILLSGPAMMSGCILNNVMRYEGKAFYAMIGLVSGGIINMIADPVFMFGLKMGIDGAGLSTAISQYISCFLLLSMFLTGKTITKFSFKGLLKDKKAVFTDILLIIKTGIPSLIRQGLGSISTITLNICAGPYGDPAIAGMTIAGRVMLFMGSVMIGVGQGLQPVSAFNYGAKKYKRLRESFRFTWLAGTLLMIIMGTCGWIFSDHIVRIFIEDPDPAMIKHALVYGTPALKCMCRAVIVQPLSIITNMLFPSVGKSKNAAILATLRSGTCYIPVLLILPCFIGFAGIQAAQMIADMLASLICIPFVIRFMKEIPAEDVLTDMDRAYMG